MNKLRIGLMGTANISRKNWNAIFRSDNSTVAAVASRDRARSEKFIRECQAETPFEKLPAAFGSYEELLASKNVDAVYIPIPTGLRKEWVIRAAESGRHVICEKPCAVNSADLEEMISACKNKSVQFMDGVMFMHNPRLKRIREALDDGRNFGRVKRIMSVFSFRPPEDFFETNIRAYSGLEPAGCLGDIGWYCIRFALWAMNWQLPRAVTGRILSQRGASGSPSPVPTDFSGELIFDDDASAGFYCSFLAAYHQWADVGGTNGYLRIPQCFHDAEPHFEVNDVRVHVERGSDPMTQDARMFHNFANQIFSGKLNEEWPSWSLKTQQVVDACLESALNR